MQGIRLLAASLVGILAMAAVAGAQQAGVPSPSPDNKVLYMHSNADASAVWMNALAADATADGTSLEGKTNLEIPAYGPSPVDPNNGEVFTWTFPLTPGLSQSFKMETGGKVTASLYLGGGSYSVGTASVVATLLSGATTIAQSEAADHNYKPAAPLTVPGAGAPNPLCPCLYDSVEVEMPIAVDLVPAGQPLSLVVQATTTGNNLFIGTSAARGPSQVSLPITELVGPVIDPDGGPLTEYFDVDGEGLLVIQELTDVNGTWVINWTASVAPTGYYVGTETVAGDFRITFASETEDLFEAEFLGAGVHEQEGNLTGTATGLHVAEITFDGYTGFFAIGVGAAGENLPTDDTTDDGTDGATDDDATDATTGTTEDTDNPKKDTPALPALHAALLALALVAVARRRLR